MKKSQAITHIVYDLAGTLAPLHSEWRSTLQEVRKRNMINFIWTMCQRSETEHFLEEYELFRFFDKLCCQGEMRPKPSPTGLEILCAQTPPEKVAVVGDSKSDILGAKKFGAGLVCGAGWFEQTDTEALRKAGADVILESPRELLDHLL